MNVGEIYFFFRRARVTVRMLKLQCCTFCIHRSPFGREICTNKYIRIFRTPAICVIQNAKLYNNYSVKLF